MHFAIAATRLKLSMREEMPVVEIADYILDYSTIQGSFTKGRFLRILWRSIGGIKLTQ